MFPLDGGIFAKRVVSSGNTKHGSFSTETGGDTILEGRKEGCSGSDAGYFPDVDVDVAGACGNYDGKACLEGRFCGTGDDVSDHWVHTCGG